MREMPVHHYYANNLLRTTTQMEAADLLLGLLLLRRQVEGQNLTYYANKWRVDRGRVYTNAQRIRALVNAKAEGFPRPTEYLQSTGTLLPVDTIKSNYRKYAPVFDDLERELTLELDDGRTEALIYGMFEDGCNAVFMRRRPKRLPRAVSHPKRGPGRPPGSKNKPKTPHHDGEGWLMPDGSRLST